MKWVVWTTDRISMTVHSKTTLSVQTMEKQWHVSAHIVHPGMWSVPCSFVGNYHKSTTHHAATEEHLCSPSERDNVWNHTRGFESFGSAMLTHGYQWRHRVSRLTGHYLHLLTRKTHLRLLFMFTSDRVIDLLWGQDSGSLNWQLL